MKPLTLPIMAALWMAQAASGYGQSLQPRIDELAAGMDDFAPQVEELPLDDIADDFGAPEETSESPQTAPAPSVESAISQEPAAAPLATVAIIPDGWEPHSLLGLTFAAPADWQLMSKPDDERELNLGQFNMAEKRAVAVMIERQHSGGVDDFEKDMEGLPKQAARDMGLDLSDAEQGFTYPEPVIAVDGSRLLRKQYALRSADFFVYSHLFYKEEADDRGGHDTLMVMSINTPEAEAMPIIEQLLGTVGLEAAPPPEAQVGVDGLVNYSMPLPKGWKRQFNSADALNFITNPTYSASMSITTGYRARQNWEDDAELEQPPEVSQGQIFGQPATIKTGVTKEPYMQVGYKLVQAMRTTYKLDICLAKGEPIVIEKYAAQSWLDSTGYDSLLETMSLALPADAIPCPAEGVAKPTPAVETAAGWTVYQNSRYGTAVEYPTSLFEPSGQASENGDGQSFASADSQAEMLVWGGQNALEQTPQQMLDDVRTAHAAATVIEQKADAMGFTIKLLEGIKIIQQHGLIGANNVVHSVRISFPANQMDTYEAATQKIMASLAVPAGAAPQPSAPASTAPSDMEQTFWDSVQGTAQAEGFEAYLAQWPDGTYAAEARQQIAQLTAPPAASPNDPQIELAFWQSIQSSSDPAMFQAYLDQWPEGTFAVLAQLNIKRLATVATAPTARPAPQPAPVTRPAPASRGYYTPARNTAERSAIMDAARVPMLRELGQKVIFLVKELRTDGEWCFLMAEPLQPNSKKLDWYSTPYANDWANDAMSNLVMILMRKQGNSWQVVDYVVGPTDVHWYNWIDGYGLPERLFNPG